MNKIFYDKQKDVFQLFLPYPLLSFSHFWNPQKDKIITKEHLKKFLEEGFLYNFYRSGSYFVLEEEFNYTPLSEFVYIYSRSLFFYLTEKNIINYKYCDHCIEFVVDSSAVYKLFSHLISEEKFSLLLKEQLKCVFGTDYISGEKIEDFRFISSKEELLSLEKDRVLFEVEDKELFFNSIEEDILDLDAVKKKNYVLKVEKKLNTSFEELDKYLN